LIADILLKNANAYTNGELSSCCLAIDDGKILKIGKEPNMPKADRQINLRNLLLLPGLIDVHVHLRDEGKSYKEDFYSGTATAAAGGITTVLDMPNNEPVTMSVEALRNRIRKAERKILVNVGFYSEFPKNLEEIKAIVDEGAVAFKLYMTEQVGGLNINDEHALVKAFQTVRKANTLVAVHAEDNLLLKRNEARLKKAGGNDIKAFLKAHPENVEVKAIERLIRIVRETMTPIHFCHVSTEKGLNIVIDGKKSKLPISSETTPHHLFLSTKELKQKGTIVLTMPPVRSKRHISALWRGIKNRWIDVVASDHAPHTLEEKKAKKIWNVKVGIPGLETTLPLLLTEVNKKNLALKDVVRLMAEKPAEIFWLKRRGFLKEGNYADFTVVDLKRKHKIDSSKFHSKAKFSPFDGRTVIGKAVKTFVNGVLVMDEGELVAEAGCGRVIRKKE